MKLSELIKLTESPIFRNEEIPIKLIKYDEFGNAAAGASITGNTIRNFEFIGTYRLPYHTAFSIFNKKIPIAHVCIRQFITTSDGDIEEVYAYLCTATFKKHPSIKQLPYPLNNRFFLQEDKIATVPVYERKGLSNHLYAALISSGYVIVSDEVHYLGGKQLWKKIAKTKKPNYNYVVYIYDVKNNNYIMDDNMMPIEYDSNNVSDDKIWFDGNIGKQYLLVAAAI